MKNINIFLEIYRNAPQVVYDASEGHWMTKKVIPNGFKK